MKKTGLLFLSLVLLISFTTSCVSMADNQQYTEAGTYRGSVPFIFIENGVEFAIYPNGEFDFAYVGQNYGHNPYSDPRHPFSYNGGYDYDMYLQFDRYGAVIQIESVPVYYDVYGRIRRAGTVTIRYTGDLVSQIGNMRIMYENHNVYIGSTGYINAYNRNFRPRPWHAYYTVPQYTIVYTTPYRDRYNPTRYSYSEHRERYANRGRSNYDNGRRTFYDPITNTPRRETTIEGRRDATQSNTNTDRGRSSNVNTNREATNTSRRNTTTTTPSENNSRRTTTPPATQTPSRTEQPAPAKRQPTPAPTRTQQPAPVKRQPAPTTTPARRESTAPAQKRSTTPAPTKQESNRGRSSGSRR